MESHNLRHSNCNIFLRCICIKEIEKNIIVKIQIAKDKQIYNICTMILLLELIDQRIINLYGYIWVLYTYLIYVKSKHI